MPKEPSVELRTTKQFPGLDLPVAEAAYFEESFRKYPQAIASTTAYADGELKEGRCEPAGFAPDLDEEAVR